MIQSIATYLPPWGTPASRRVGSDEDVVTMAVAAGRPAIAAVPVRSVLSVVVVSRDLPLLEGGNSAALLAGLGLDATTEVREQLGGAPATLEAAAGASHGTLVIGADASPAGAAAVLCGPSGPALVLSGRVSRSLPVITRNATGEVTEYADPRLLRERGIGVSLARLGTPGPVGKAAAVAGSSRKEAAQLSEGDPPALPTLGASAALFALAAIAERGDGGRILAVEQATVACADLSDRHPPVARDEPAPLPSPPATPTPGADISISLPAYERAFDVKLRLAAARCAACGTLALPPRFRCLGCGSQEPTEIVELPRQATVYTVTTIHVPVPSLVTPYTLAVVELGDSGVRALVHVTGAPPGSVAIGDEGRMVFRRVATRSGVPDYGYAFLPEARTEVAA